MRKTVLFTAQIFLTIPEESSNVDISTKIANYAERQVTKFCTQLENHYADTGAQDIGVLVVTQHL